MIRRVLWLVLPIICAMSGLAQSHHRDPLTEAEIDKIRDSAQLPEVRLKLYIEFARARLDNIQKVHSDPKAAEREKQTRDALQEFMTRLTPMETLLPTAARTCAKP